MRYPYVSPHRNKKMNPYVTVWLKPKETVNKILSGEVEFKFYIPILLAGLSAFIGEFLIEFELAEQLIIIILGTAFGFVILGYFFPWLVLKTGKIWKGESTFKDLQYVFGLAQIPAIVILILQLVNLAFGRYRSYEAINYGIQIIVWIFYMRTLIIGISKAQRFGYVQLIVNLVVSVLPILIIRLVIG